MDFSDRYHLKNVYWDMCIPPEDRSIYDKLWDFYDKNPVYQESLKNHCNENYGLYNVFKQFSEDAEKYFNNKDLGGIAEYIIKWEAEKYLDHKEIKTFQDFIKNNNKNISYFTENAINTYFNTYKIESLEGLEPGVSQFRNKLVNDLFHSDKSPVSQEFNKIENEDAKKLIYCDVSKTIDGLVKEIFIKRQISDEYF